MFSYDNEIRLLGSGLLKEETLPNTVCPHCNGGLTKESTFSVTRGLGGLIYNCYRASCTMQGFTSDKDRVVSTDTAVPKPHIKPKPRFSKATQSLTTEQKAWFMAQFYLTYKEVENSAVSFCKDSDSFVFPIWNRHGTEVGTIDRSWTGRTPKAINRWHLSASNLYFPNIRQPKKYECIVLVEDALSAIKVARYHPCVALLGVTLTKTASQLLRSLTGTLVIALDNDATSAALKLSKQHSWMFNSIKVQHLPKDPKDMDDDKLQEVFDREY